MCVIERFHRIHPNGFREPKERFHHCQYGSPVTPCNDTRVVNAMDELLGPAVAAAPGSHHQIIEAAPVDRHRPEERRKKPKKIVDDIKLIFDFHIPFTSHRKEKKAKKPKKPYKDPRPEGGMGQPKGPEHFTIPPGLRYPPPQTGFPGPTMHPAPPPPPPPMHGPPMHVPRMGQPGGQITPPISVYSFGSTDSSPSPVTPTREHQRPRARSLSLTRQYEERKRVIREQERREHAERVARAGNAARIRAEIDAERIREERDRERRRNEDLQAREQRRQNEAAERERRQRRQEERERQAQAIAARQRREDADRRLAAEAVVERERRQLARRRRDEEERQWRVEEERRRLERQQRAIIPRAPRHAVEIHHHHHHHEPDGFEHEARGNFEQRGDQVINDAIRARQARQAEQRWPAEGGPRRRRTIGAGERRVFDDDRRRWGDLGRRWF